MRLALVSMLLCGACTCDRIGVLEDGGEGGGTGGGNNGAGGGSGGGNPVACIPGLGPLTLAPAASTVTVGSQPMPVRFTATGAPGGDVTSQLQWSVSRDDDTPPGGFSSPGVYQPAAGAGGVVTIRATDGCVTATTTLTLKLDVTLRDPGPTVTTRFGGAPMTSATKSPVIVYPSDQTRIPRNIYKILFQWQKAGNDFFRLTFDGPGAKVVVYSDGAHPHCAPSAATNGCMEADTAAWLAIAGSNAGQTVTLTVDGVTMGDANVYRSAAITIGFSKRDVKGAIFYWSTTAAGVRRASVSDNDPEDYLVAKPIATVLPNNAGTVKCVACHTVSRSGKKLAGFTQATATGEFIYDVTLQPPPIPTLTTQLSTTKGFATFRPDDLRIVSTIGANLAEFHLDGGKVTNLPPARGTNPDWSPKTTELMYSDQSGDSPGSANLSVIAYDGGWGAVRVLVPAAGQSNLFPSCTPDGEYVAYARGRGGHGDRTFQLWLVKADGTQPPVELVTANRVVNSALTLGQHENTMPTWAPPGDLLWVAFNTVRPYGVVLPAGGTQQIWVAAIDPAKLGQRLPDGGLVDPSFPAFRFAFQGLTENNHRAFWTLDVRDPPDAGPTCTGLGSVCSSTPQCCAGLECGTGELLRTCQPPGSSDAGNCLMMGAACNQTSGPTCCAGQVCDVDPADGGLACRVIIN